MPGIIKKLEIIDESFNKVTQTEDWVSINQDLDYSQVLSRVDSQTQANNNVLSESTNSLLKTLQTENINANLKPVSPESDFKESSPPKLFADEIISEKQVPSKILGKEPEFRDFDVSESSQYNEDSAIPNEPKPSQPIPSSPKKLVLPQLPSLQPFDLRNQPLETPKIVTCCNGNLLPDEGVGFDPSTQKFYVSKLELAKSACHKCWDTFKYIPINLAVFSIKAIHYSASTTAKGPLF
jgi:hypothetical protein